MTPLERAARALYKQIGSDFDPFNEGEDAKWPEFIDAARAVVQAIREPSEGVAEAMAHAVRASQQLVKSEHLRCDEARLAGLAAQATFIDEILSA